MSDGAKRDDRNAPAGSGSQHDDHATRTIRSSEPGKAGRRTALLLAVLALLIALAGGLSFLILYWSDRGSTATLGISLAAAFAGMGLGLVIWAHGLMPDEEVSGDRERLASSEEEIAAFQEDFAIGENKIARRKLLGWMAGGTVALLTLGTVSLVKSLGRSPLPALLQTAWQEGARLVTTDGVPVSTNLDVGNVLTVFPEGNVDSIVSQTILMRVDEKLLNLSADRADWAPQGYIAFSKICTHAGCSVAQFERNRNILLCPCHQSAFDVLRGAVPVGGPAGQPLPQLPLFIDGQGYLRARGDFSSPSGPGFWRYP